MVTLRLTQRLKRYLGIQYSEPLQPANGKLSDWYANLIPTYIGGLIIFTNEQTLLTVAIPVSEVANIFPLFQMRVENMLGMIGIPFQAADIELSHFNELQFTKTRSRSVLASMNDFVNFIQFAVEDASPGNPIFISDLEYRVNETPCGPMNYDSPIQVTRELLSSKR